MPGSNEQGTCTVHVGLPFFLLKEILNLNQTGCLMIIMYSVYVSVMDFRFLHSCDFSSINFFSNESP